MVYITRDGNRSINFTVHSHYTENRYERQQQDERVIGRNKNRRKIQTQRKLVECCITSFHTSLCKWADRWFRFQSFLADRSCVRTVSLFGIRTRACQRARHDLRDECFQYVWASMCITHSSVLEFPSYDDEKECLLLNSHQLWQVTDHL